MLHYCIMLSLKHVLHQFVWCSPWNHICMMLSLNPIRTSAEIQCCIIDILYYSPWIQYEPLLKFSVVVCWDGIVLGIVGSIPMYAKIRICHKKKDPSRQTSNPIRIPTQVISRRQPKLDRSMSQSPLSLSHIPIPTDVESAFIPIWSWSWSWYRRPRAMVLS